MVTAIDDAATREAAVRHAFHRQAYWCRNLGSPFTAELCETVGERLTGDSAVGARILGWQGQPDALGDSVPLRLMGVLHALVRRGAEPALAAHYPPHASGGRDALWQAISGVLARQEREILKWLELPPQTNEVARSAVLMAGLHVIAAETHLPFALFELGCSGGLNLMLDRFTYRLGSLDAGIRNSAVQLAPQWNGPSPPSAEVRIVSRRGVDQAPLDVRKASDRERLLGYIWPDMTERLARTAAAIEIEAADPPRIDTADAADWLETTLAIEPESGITRVVFHSIAFQYFPMSSQTRVADHIARVGAKASKDAPFAWLRFELTDGSAALILTLWPGGTERILSTGDAHVRTVNWR